MLFRKKLTLDLVFFRVRLFASGLKRNAGALGNSFNNYESGLHSFSN